MNHYQLLGIPRQASREEIRAAYLHLARELHPDRHVGAESAAAGREKFLRIQAAYEVLRDPEKRRLYDLEYREIPPLRTQPATSHGSASVASTPGVTPGRRRDVPEGWVRGSRRSAKFLTFAKSLATLVVVLMMLFAIVPRIGRALWQPQEPEIPSLLVEEAARRNKAARMSSRVRPDLEGDAIRKARLTRQLTVVDEATEVDGVPTSDGGVLPIKKIEIEDKFDQTFQEKFKFESEHAYAPWRFSPAGEVAVESPFPIAQPNSLQMQLPPLESSGVMGDEVGVRLFPSDSSSSLSFEAPKPTQAPFLMEPEASPRGSLIDQSVLSKPMGEPRTPPKSRRQQKRMGAAFGNTFHTSTGLPPSSTFTVPPLLSEPTGGGGGRGVGSHGFSAPSGLPTGDIPKQPLSTAISQTEKLLGDQRPMSTGQQSGIRSVPDFSGDYSPGSGIGAGSFPGRLSPGGPSPAGGMGADWGRGMTPESRTGLGNGRWSTPSVGGATSSPWGRSNAGQTFMNANPSSRTNQLLQQRP